MKTIPTIAAVAALSLVLASCGSKKKSDNIIAQRVEKPQVGAPVRMQNFDQERDVQWIGRTYHLTLHRQPADSLAMVKDEQGQQYVDNEITVVVSRADGSVFFNRKFTKEFFAAHLDDDYRNTGILEGFVFDRADGDDLVFAASVSHPQTDEYIPLVVRLTRMGELSVKRDTELDTRSGDDEDTE